MSGQTTQGASRLRRAARAALMVAVFVAPPPAAFAASPEDAYLAARDRYIAAFKKPPKGADEKKLFAAHDKALADLQGKLKPIVGPVAAAGFPAAGKINLDTLFAEDEGFGMLDGLVFGETESDKSLVVTTDGLLDKWLEGHRSLPASAAEAVKTEDFYTQAVNTDAAVADYGEIQIVAPPGAKFAHAMLSLAGNGDIVPGAPDRIYLALEQGGRVFIVDEKLTTPVPAIPVCDGAGAKFQKESEAADKAYMAGGGKDKKLLAKVESLRTQGDHAVTACFAEKAKGTPAFKAATDQAAAIIAALAGK